MKKEFNAMPQSMKQLSFYGFSWEDFVTAIPSPLVVVTSYKDNGQPNATLQSWCTFVSSNGFYCIFADVNRTKHMYRTVKQTGQLVINFPSADCYARCEKTIIHNRDEDDELAMAGLTAEPASCVNAPRIRECFLNLECEYVWEKEITPESSGVVMCVRIVNVCMDEAHFDETEMGRYGETGYLYNIHNPVNPVSGSEAGTAIGILHRLPADTIH